MPVTKTAVDKGRTPLAGWCALGDVWWQGVWHAGPHMALTPMGRRWMAEVVLPLMEGQQQAARTRCPRRKATILQACKALQAQCATHPMPQTLAPEVRADGQAWAAERAQTFQRASSAVEGRNGSLSQRHHHHRGLPQRRDKVWTVLQHFDVADEHFPTSLRPCSLRLATCPGRANDIRPWRSVIDAIECPALSECSKRASTVRGGGHAIPEKVNGPYSTVRL